ncbi:MAG TPA: hypothetical protein VN726_07285 [Hanamia sp.]|nr:hypothetical protein [Hanamia sp.]
MERSEPLMTETESLQLISSMINKAKNRYTENGVLYLLWGWLIFTCCIIQFVSLHFFNFPKAYYAWYATWMLFIYQIFYMRKRNKSRKVTMYTGEIIGYVWLVFIITYALLVYILVYLRAPEAILPAILTVFGIPTFLSGVILKFKSLKIGGICCWILALISPFVSPEYQYLLMACAVAAGWIIPGHLLNQKFKKGNSNGG